MLLRIVWKSVFLAIVALDTFLKLWTSYMDHLKVCTGRGAEQYCVVEAPFCSPMRADVGIHLRSIVHNRPWAQPAQHSSIDPVSLMTHTGKGILFFLNPKTLSIYNRTPALTFHILYCIYQQFIQRHWVKKINSIKWDVP